MIKKCRFILALIIAKILKAGLNVTKLSAGTAMIGKIVLQICPDFLSLANKYIDKKLNITGTNGKTTTSGIISHLIKADGGTLINNAMGANMLNGVANAIAVQLNPLKHYQYSVIESDEAFLEVIYEKYDADYLVVTNLFRDQLDRYGELENTKKFIQNGIDKKPELRLILNADDPLVASLESKNEKIYYGVEEVIYKDGTESINKGVEEAFNCPCGRPLKYKKKFFAQQGHYYCDCGYSRPNVKYSAKITIYKNYSVLDIEGVEYKIDRKSVV